MKEYVASVRDKETNTIKILKGKYATKKEYENDLRKNGYAVRFITTEENFDSDCEKWNKRNEENKRIAKMKYEARKKFANEHGMTRAQYDYLIR